MTIGNCNNIRPVAVAGAGPAGCAAAIALRLRGVPVVIFDKARFPRDKVCGDVLLPASLAAVQSLGLPMHELKSMAYECSGCRYFAPGGREISGTFRDMAGRERASWTIPRRLFDAWLVQHAAAAGAIIHQEHTVAGLQSVDGGPRLEIRKSNGSSFYFAASFVVGADGAFSTVARQLGLLRHDPEHTCLAVRGYASGLKMREPFLEIFTTRRTLPGCAWILPVGQNSANVGVGILKSTARKNATSPTVLFREVAATLPQFSRRLDGIALSEMRGWPLPGATERRALVRGRCLLVGDAGAMIDPFTGHGIHHALTAGRLAAETIADAIERRDFSATALKDYPAKIETLLGRETDLGSTLQRIHASPALMNAMTRLANFHSGIRDTFFALVGHANERREIFTFRNLSSTLFRFGNERSAL